MRPDRPLDSALDLSREAFLEWDTMPNFCAEHLVCLAGVAACLGLVTAFRTSEPRPVSFRLGLVLAWLAASGYFAWLVAVLWLGAFVPSRDLPLEFCYLVGLSAPVALGTRNQVAFDFLYYGATSGVLHACITPIFAPSFPHPRFFAFWALHGGAVVTAAYAVLVLGMRPTYRGIFTATGVVFCILCVVIPVNYWLDANYCYLREKPAGSVQELFGPWPFYVTATLLLGLINFHIAYLPFAARRKRSPASPLADQCPELSN